MADYELIVGNIGSVYVGTNGFKAYGSFNRYRSYSKHNYGRAGGETVTLFKDGEIIRAYIGSIAAEDGSKQSA